MTCRLSGDPVSLPSLNKHTQRPPGVLGSDLKITPVLVEFSLTYSQDSHLDSGGHVCPTEWPRGDMTCSWYPVYVPAPLMCFHVRSVRGVESASAGSSEKCCPGSPGWGPMLQAGLVSSILYRKTLGCLGQSPRLSDGTAW